LRFPLDHPPVTDTPTYDSLFETWQEPNVPISRESISRLFYESLAISAWKQAGGNRWSLRVNPSSGDLHPTEAYLIAGRIKDFSEVPAVFHYSAYEHALERRVILSSEEWDAIGKNLPTGCLLVALTSIYWRESWKYGERAFRYCHHDVGHAVGTVTFAAAALGLQTRLIHSIGDDELGTLLGLHQQEDVEAEQPDCLLALFPAGEVTATTDPVINLPAQLIERLNKAEFEGRPNRLSRYWHEWPIIDAVSAACHFDGGCSFNHKQDPRNEVPGTAEFEDDRCVSARQIIRERRSALAMDARSAISKAAFYRMMANVSPQPGNSIIKVLPWRARISLALFIHRVDGMSPGLYLLIRDPEHEPSLRGALSSGFRWERPEDCPGSVNLYLLTEADARDAARMICCHQDITADGAFSLGMLAEFDASLEQHGAPFYPRLFWETGLIGQILYLEAEAAGIRSTGIGCFFDDAMHEVLGIHGHVWQSLYHFAVGGPVDDPRLQTLPSYWYLK
ncbi:MAG: SagB/ThcOx family dehydrogenase, partial [Gammaproteobacteria bacterium]|nr:SagB/ThcOx family dehydrogenase [Gammaproteobacteria bacterium]